MREMGKAEKENARKRRKHKSRIVVNLRPDIVYRSGIPTVVLAIILTVRPRPLYKCL